MDQKLFWKLVAKKLSGEASLVEQKELEELLRENPDMHYPLQIIIDLWSHERHQIRQAASNAFDRHTARMQAMRIDFDAEKLCRTNYEEAESPSNSKRTRRIRIALLGMGGLLVILAITIYTRFYPFRSQARDVALLAIGRLTEYSAHNGSTSDVVLPDGTKVKLNSGSRLTYDRNYGKTVRGVNLTGEAFFDVVKNKQKPFIIQTKNIIIRVLGTTFDVKSYPNESTETSLVRGSLEVSFKNKQQEIVILKPNQKLIIANEELPLNSPKSKSPGQSPDPEVAISQLNYSKRDSTIIETAWVQNKLVFRNELFGQLALQMERWYNVTIRFSDQEIAALTFTGTFEKETIQQALDALQLSGRFRYSMKDSEIVISR